MTIKQFVKPKGLPQEAFNVWEKVFEQNKKKGEEKAAKIAWSAVKNGWKKEGDKWVRKEASEIEKPHHFKGSVTDLSSLNLDPTQSRLSIIEVMRVGTWNHPIYGEFDITHDKLERFVQNFDNGLRKALAIDVEHKSDEGAVGWFKRLFVQEDVLFAEIEWTEEGIGLIQQKKYRFFSPEFADEYEDASSGKEYKDVLIGGAITNRPFFQELEEITLSERAVNSYKFTKKADEEAGYGRCPECKKKLEKEKMKDHLLSVHNKKGGENMAALTKDDLKKLFAENSELTLEEAKKKGEVDEKLFNEVKDEVAGDGDGDDDGDEDKDTDKDDAEGADDDSEGEEGGDKPPKKGSEKTKTVKLSEDQYQKLIQGANAGSQAVRELREMRVVEQVRDFTYSESNKEGVLLPKSTEAVKKFMMSLSDKQRIAFAEILNSLPKIKLFSEIGGSEDNSEKEDMDTIHGRATKLMSEAPDKYKTYSEAAYEAEKQLKAEGKTGDEIYQ